jgi:hypothetical protein
MARSSRAQMRRRRLGLPDSAPVDPETSQRNRRAAMARWSKAGKEYTADEVALGVGAKPTPAKGGVVMHPRTERRRDQQVTARAAGHLQQERAAALYEVGSMLRSASRVHRQILNDTTVRPEVRLQAVKLVYEIVGLGEAAGVPAKDISELSLEELDAFILSADRELAKREEGATSSVDDLHEQHSGRARKGSAGRLERLVCEESVEEEREGNHGDD